jgi:8-oxo-dGTP diphosphatase
MKIIKPVDLIVINNNKILLLKRTEKDSHEPGKWGVPGGGSKLGETPEQTLKREIKEETNCKITWFKLFNKYEYIFENTPIEVIYYYGKITGDLKISNEHSQFKWFHFSEIKNLDLGFNQKQVLLEFIKTYNKT